MRKPRSPLTVETRSCSRTGGGAAAQPRQPPLPSWVWAESRRHPSTSLSPAASKGLLTTHPRRTPGRIGARDYVSPGALGNYVISARPGGRSQLSCRGSWGAPVIGFRWSSFSGGYSEVQKCTKFEGEGSPASPPRRWKPEALQVCGKAAAAGCWDLSVRVRRGGSPSWQPRCDLGARDWRRGHRSPWRPSWMNTKTPCLAQQSCSLAAPASASLIRVRKAWRHCHPHIFLLV